MNQSFLLSILTLVCAGLLSAQSKSPDLSGYWELRFDSRNVPPASLVAPATPAERATQVQHDADAIRWCHFFGVPYMMAWSPVEIVQNTNGKEIAITSPVRTPARHIYTDGRRHVSPDTFDPTSTGNSIGHWEGDTLVVDTIGFSDEGILAIPGGGSRTATSHLMERYRLLNGGQRLSVLFTWEDPKMYATPHTYEFRYYRAPPGTEAREFDCNASDTERAKFLTGVPGKMNEAKTRRDFINGVPLAAAGLALAASTPSANAQGASGKPDMVRYPLGIQLFALIGRDLPRTWEKYSAAIEAAANMGYEFIEPAGLWGFDPKTIRKKAEESGLRVRSLHMGFDQMNDLPPETTMAQARDVVYASENIVSIARSTAPVARDLGCEWGVIASSATSSYKSVDSIKRLCNAFNEASVIVQQGGLKFGYHMHSIDFTPVDGVLPYELLLEQTDPAVRYELDVCWAEAGGVNPADFIKKYPKKIVSFHLQDLTPEKKVANPGTGIIDFKAIHEVARKLDNPMFLVDRDGVTGDARVEQAKQAFRYLQGLGWGKAA